jgi:hypothetical protein
MNKQALIQKFEECFNNVMDKTEQLFLSQELAITAKVTLKTAKANLLSDGIEGKNEAERSAKLDVMVSGELNHAEACESKVRMAQFQLDLSRIELDKQKTILRVYELNEVQG